MKNRDLWIGFLYNLLETIIIYETKYPKSKSRFSYESRFLDRALILPIDK